MINLIVANKLWLIFPFIGGLTFLMALRRVARMGQLAQALPGFRAMAPIMLDQAPRDVREPRMRREDLRLNGTPQTKRHRVLIVGSGDVGADACGQSGSDRQIYGNRLYGRSRRG